MESSHQQALTVHVTDSALALHQLYLRLWRGHGAGEPAHAVLMPPLCCFSRRGIAQGRVPSLTAQPATAACGWRARISKR